MFRKHFDGSVLKDLSWWHWTLTIPLLVMHLAGYSWAGPAAIGLCAVAGGFFLSRLKRIRPYPVQTRLAYLGLLLCGMPASMDWIYWLSLIGTMAMVVVGYCPLLRLLSIASWNRTAPLSLSLVWRAFAREPCAGGILRWPNYSSAPTLSCCSAPARFVPSSCTMTSFPAASPSVQETPHAHVH